MTMSAREPTAAPHLWRIALVLGVALAAAAAVTLWHLRRDAINSQARELRLLSVALNDEIGRGLQGAQEGLQAMREELREGRLAATGSESRRSLRTRADLMPLVETLWLIDDDGRLLSASDDAPPPPPQAFLPALDALEGDAIAVSQPFVEAATRQSMVALAVRFSAAAGPTRGWVLAALPAEALLGAFSAAAPAADARMAVFRSDGARLAGSIVANPVRDAASVAERLSGMPSLAIHRFSDGTDRLVGLQALPRFGLHLMLTRDLDALLAPWRAVARLTVAGMLLLLAIMAVSVVLVQRADRRRVEAQRALQAQRLRASKLEALGTMAGGVAHDFNNVLAAILGFGEMAQDAAPQGSAQARHLGKLMQAGLRGKALVERILAFSRGSGRASIVFELEPVVDEVLALLATSLRPGVVLERALEAPGARLRGDPTRAFEAVMNLCTNAMQAMPKGGALSVRLQRQQVAEERVLSHSHLAAGDYLVLTVADEGSGISAEVMEHLFEPFFTTRAAQSGTGLGLAVVHGVVAEFGGAIDVHSAPGRGARFTLYFPESEETPAAPASPRAPAPAGSGQALLVVDDEPTLVAMTEEVLRGLGFAPVGFSDPSQALQAVREQPRRFAAVITDEVMPGLSGTQLTEALRAHAPDLPVLLISGYGGALLASRAAASGVTRVLAKPLQRAELAQALAEVLH